MRIGLHRHCTIWIRATILYGWQRCVCGHHERIKYRGIWHVISLLLSGRCDSLPSAITTRPTLVLGRDFSGFVLKNHYDPSVYVRSTFYVSHSSLPFQSAVGGMIMGDLTFVSMKFNRTPRLQSRLDFLQFTLDPVSYFHLRSSSIPRTSLANPHHTSNDALDRSDIRSAPVSAYLRLHLQLLLQAALN